MILLKLALPMIILGLKNGELKVSMMAIGYQSRTASIERLYKMNDVEVYAFSLTVS
ncbi:hypothetical protein [Streptococcus halotolerans]|uniref:hypothetical protein n=1 Tax=Streptococcus halotolerans TaxID=1814128 RepID=UPI000AA52885|nr:hypothetical protein [Streptococcus halotolerans]